MNVFQKIGVFIMRLLGVVMVIIAVMGACMYAVHSARGTLNADISTRLPATIEWFVAGSVLLAMSKPVGKFIGAGLG